MASEGGTEDAKRRGDAFARAFSAHLARFGSLQQIPPVQSSLCYFDYNLPNRKFIVKTLLKILFLCFCLMLVIYFVCRLMEEPAAYGKLGLANLLELREECLREFQFVDAYRSIKQRYTIVLSLFYLEFFLCSLFLRN